MGHALPPTSYIMGHEGAGIVSEVGSGVDHVKPGDPVVLNWAIPCGACFQCSRGAENVCEHRRQLPDERFRGRGRAINTSFALGTMATYALVPGEAVVPLDPGIPFAEACIFGCGVMTGFGSAVNAAKIVPGSSVVVIGCGGVELSVIQGAAYRGARCGHNSGKTKDVDLATLKFELNSFVCEGEYLSGMRRVLQAYRDSFSGPEQKAAWISGFYGSGKSHLAKVLRYCNT